MFLLVDMLQAAIDSVMHCLITDKSVVIDIIAIRTIGYNPIARTDKEIFNRTLEDIETFEH
jgi:hypothetical protein